MLISQGHAGISADSHPACISRRGERQWRWLLPAAPPAVLTGLVALLGTLLLAAEARTQDLAADRAALVALYNATDGPNWDNNRNWLSGRPLREWSGVAVQNGRVARLFLHINQLKGTLPTELANLTNLQELSLFHNQLTGPIPPELGLLANLRRLHLGGNRLAGPIPPELGKLANLEELVLFFNQLTGHIPSELGHLANLRKLSLVDNQLTGAIPPELSHLTYLQDLSLDQNQLTGPIPPELGNLANLQELSLSNNPLTGPIPSELGNLTNIQELDLVNNQLTGPIPPELGNLANLEAVALTSNQLTGPIPPELGNLSHLQALRLSNNELTGPIPSELGDLANLERLWLGTNQLRGPIPSELGDLANLTDFLLSENQLTGRIPPELGNLTNLETLHLSTNQLTGSIPPELGDFANLEQLFLTKNQLTGPIPPELGNLVNVRRLSLRENQLAGSIPSELGDLAKLETLSLYINQLTGPIPPELGNLASLEALSLGYNQLSGPIPSELGNLANLGGLSLEFNQLTGSIPRSFANLVALDSFWFYVNPGLCVGADAGVRNRLDGVRIVGGPDCSPSITLSVVPSNLVEGSGATPVMVTATQAAVGNPTGFHFLIGGAATTGETQDYRIEPFSGSFNGIFNVLTIPANRASASRILTFVPLADNLREGTENIILQVYIGGIEPFRQGSFFGGSAILTLNDQAGCESRDRAALEALFHATGGTGWVNSTNWLSTKPLSEWHGVTVDNKGCVAHLDLSNNRLVGQLPLQLGYLVGLEQLNLSKNYLAGIIPASFTNLVALKKFSFHLNFGLCAQGDTSIRTWLGGIGDFQGADCSTPETTSPIFVPVLLTSAGRRNSLFTSELTLTNRGEEEVTLHYTYTAHAGGGSGTATDSLAAGRQKIEADALGYLRRLGVPIPAAGNRIGTLRVEVTGSSEVSVVTRTTTAVPDGRAGLAYPGITEQEGFQEAVYLCGLRQNTQDRSNLALQNMGTPGDGPVTLRTTLFSGEADDASSRVLGEVTLQPGGFHQYSELLGRLGSPAQGYVMVEKVDGDAPFYAYGVINDNFNSDGSFVFPVTESFLVGARGQTLPVIIETESFQSELTLTNFSASDKTINFSFVADGVETTDDTAGFSLELKAGEQRILPSLVSQLREQEVDGIGPAGRDFVGALFATPTEGDLSGLVIGARTGALDERGGQYSLFYNGVPYGSASVESAWIYGLQQNAENRSNLALVNTGEIDDSSSTFEITIYDGSGGAQPRTISRIVAARGWHQVNGILGRSSQGYVQVRKVSGNNPFVAYGVINDGGRRGERSGDGAYLPAAE